jgi:hypothetical protein
MNEYSGSFGSVVARASTETTRHRIFPFLGGNLDAHHGVAT